MRSSLHDMELAIIVSSFNVLALIVKFLNYHSNLANVVHEVLSELLVINEFFLMILDSELSSSHHRV